MTQQSGNQFDDDLTVGMDDSDSFSTGSIDLFEFAGDEESPIARLKTIILSIDWEINDDILQQLDDELLDLGDIWAGDKIKQVYIQGLSKIGKYINKERAGAHPNSIKLLIKFYHHLEKIVSSDDEMTEEEKKKLLLEDVKNFDTLKAQISQLSAGTPLAQTTQESILKPGETEAESGDVLTLKVLKALVLGLDWEINDRDLQSLGEEVLRLEKTFSQSKVKLVLLQGIGALSSYINDMRSQANGKAFTLLHSFYGTLEKIAGSELAVNDEKELVLAEVSKFNAFKAEIAQAKTAPASVAAASTETSPAGISESSPASDFTDTEEDDTSAIDSRLDSVFGDTSIQESVDDGSEEAALEGVNVETEADDDSDEEALPFQEGGVAPALSDATEVSSFSVEKLADDLAPTSDTKEAAGPEKPVASSDEDAETVTDDVYGEELFPSEEEDLAPAFADVSDDSSSSVENLTDDLFGTTESDEDAPIEPEVAMPLPGVDVETEADDDSEEEDLPVDQGELAPALTSAVDDQGFDEKSIAFDDEDLPSDDLEDRLGDFFDDEMEASSEEWKTEKEPGSIETVETDADLIAAQSDLSEDGEEKIEEAAEEALSFLDDEEADTSQVDAAEEYPHDSAEEPDEHALADTTDIAAIEEEASAIEEHSVDEDITEETTDEVLSFLDDEEDVAPAAAEPEELPEIVADDSEVEENVAAAPEEVESEREEPAAVVESVEDSTEEMPSVFDEEETVAPAAVEIIEEEAEEVITADTIDFTVPGEVSVEAEPDETEEELSGTDDQIDFDVPGEVFVAEAALFSSEGDETEAVVFEAVGDDVEVDRLPGEEYVDQLETESSTDEEEVEFTEATEEPFVDIQDNLDKYIVLRANLESLRGNITEENIQKLYCEVNRLRSSAISSHTDKIFLQLFSTVSQHIERGDEGVSPGTDNLSLLDEILTGLEMSPGNIDRVQQHLLGCISQVLLLRQNS